MARALALGILIAGSALGAAQNRPLPDHESFLAETRKHLQTDGTLQSGYVYVETRRELKLDKSGRSRGESVKVFESYPGFPGEERWERLIAEDGRPVPPEELARQDRERQRKAHEIIQRLSRDSSKELARQERELEKAYREREAAQFRRCWVASYAGSRASHAARSGTLRQAAASWCGW